MAKNRSIISTFLIAIVVLWASQTIYSQNTSQMNQNDFEKQLFVAYAERNTEQIMSLIKEHRLWVKPFVDKLLSESMQLELQGDIEVAQQRHQMAENVANTFKKTFGEQSLVTAIAYVSSWSREQKAKKLLADSLYTVGTKLRGKKEQRDEALHCYLRALEIYKQIRDQRGEGTTLGGLGVIYWYKGDSRQTLSYFQQALKLRQKVDDKQLIGNSFSDIGSVHNSFFRDYSKALEYYLKAEKIRREIGDGIKLGQTLSRIALSYEYLGQLDSAFTNYAKAFELYQTLGDESGLARALHNSGYVLIDMGNYNTALDYLERALKIKKKLEDKKGTTSTLTLIGIVYKRLGEFEKAMEIYNDLLGLAKETGDEKGMADIFSNMGIILGNIDRTEKAAEYHQKALEIFEKLEEQEGILDVLSNLGVVNLDLRNYKKSEEYIIKALQLSRELQNKEKEVNNLINLGNVQDYSGKLKQAFSNYQEGLKIANSMNNPELIWPAMLGLGDNYERRGEYDKAIEHYSQALKTVEEMRGTLQSKQHKASFMDKKRFAFEAVIHLTGKLHEKDKNSGYDTQAFYLAERAKARAFLDLLAEALANVREGADPILLQKKEELLADLSQVQQQLQHESSKIQTADSTVVELKDKINALEKEYRNLQKEINLKNPKYSELQYPQPVTIKALQSNVLDDNTILLEYSVGDSSSSLWVIMKNSKQLFRLPNRDALQEQVDIIRYALLNPKQSSPEFFAKTSYRLYQILVNPAEAFIKKNKRLLIIPDGVLHYLPFEILLTENSVGKAVETYSKLPYLIKRNPISYAQSSSVLQSLRKQRGKGKKSFQKQLLAFGDPVFGEVNDSPLEKLRAAQSTSGDKNRSGLARLKYSGAEIESIAKLFPPEEVSIYLRGEAKEEKVKEKGKLSEFRYVHFATHGIINERKPDFSSIVLTQDNDPKEDGFLHAAEIFNLSMNAELVTLSACQTGLGKMVRGEGMIGLTRAFMYAGSPSVLVSLWSVSDISTAKLMKIFYGNLIKKKKEKTESLQRAQLSMIDDKQFSHPFYWAPFVLIGDWQ